MYAPSHRDHRLHPWLSRTSISAYKRYITSRFFDWRNGVGRRRGVTRSNQAPYGANGDRQKDNAQQQAGLRSEQAAAQKATPTPPKGRIHTQSKQVNNIPVAIQGYPIATGIVPVATGTVGTQS
jgi:hypothetical protein